METQFENPLEVVYSKVKLLKDELSNCIISKDVCIKTIAECETKERQLRDMIAIYLVAINRLSEMFDHPSTSEL